MTETDAGYGWFAVCIPPDKQKRIEAITSPLQRPRRELPLRPEKNPACIEWGALPDLPMNRALAREERLAKRLQHAIQQLHECVEVSPAIRGGIPVLKGTRFTVAQVLAEMAEGRSIAEIADGFDLDLDCLKNLLHGFAICLDRPVGQ